MLLERYSPQTHRPGHYNFSEKFIFELRLKRGIDKGVGSGLQALDVKQIHLFFCGVESRGKVDRI